MTQKPRKGDFWELKPEKIARGSMRPKHTRLEACAFGARLGNRSPFILDPRLNEFTLLTQSEVSSELACVASVSSERKAILRLLRRVLESSLGPFARFGCPG